MDVSRLTGNSGRSSSRKMVEQRALSLSTVFPVSLFDQLLMAAGFALPRSRSNKHVLNVESSVIQSATT